MNKNNINKNMTFWEGWDDEMVWAKIDVALNKKKRKRFFIYFLFGTLILFPMILSLSSTKSINNDKSDTSHSMNATIYEKRSPSTGNNEHNLIAPMLDSSDIIKNRITKNTEISGIYERTKSLMKFNNVSNKENHSLNKSISADHEIESSFTPIFVSIEKPEHLNQIPGTYSEVNNMPIYQSLLSESSNSTDDLNAWIKNLIDNASVSQNLKKPVRKNKPLSLQYSSGIGIGTRKDYFDENMEWQTLKHTNEKYLYSISHSLKISKALHSNWKFNVGIGYVAHISNLKGVNIHKEETLVPSDSARFQNINGTYHYYNGNLIKTTITRQSYDVVNWYSTYLIPFSITYTKEIKGHQFLFGIGSQLNLLNEFNGYTYNEESKIEKINLTAKKNIRGSIGLNTVSTSIGYCRAIYSNFSFMTELEYSIPLLPTYIQENPSDQVYKSKYTYCQFKLGVQYRLK